MKRWLPFALAVLLIACTAYDHDVPDTQANREGFARHFDVAPPSDVTNLYYFADELGADANYQLGFEATPETVDRIVEALDLNPSPEAQEQGLGLAYDMPWWDETEIAQATHYRKSTAEEDYFWALWYHEATGRVYYLEYSL